MKKLLFSLLIPGCIFAETELKIANSDFESSPANWKDKFTAVVKEAAHSGNFGLRVHDKDDSNGASYNLDLVPVTPGKTYVFRYWARDVSQTGAAGVYMQFYNANRKLIAYSDDSKEHIQVVYAKDWTQHVFTGVAPKDAAFIRVWIHSFNGSQGTTDFDDFKIAELSPEEAKTVKSSPDPVKRTVLPAISQERVAEIAAMLSDKPMGLGPHGSERKLWEPYVTTERALNMVKNAEKYLKQPPVFMDDNVYLEFTRNGNRTNYQRIIGQRSSRLNAFVFAELVEWKGRFIPALEADLMRLFSEKSWTLPAHDASLTCFNQKIFHGDLVATDVAANLAQIDWWFQDKLSPAVRQRLREECFKRVITPYREDIRSRSIRGGHWWIIGGNNWNAVCTANLVRACMILLEDKMERAEILAAMENSNPIFLNGFSADGYCSEGIGYWGYGFGHFALMAEIVLNVTNGKLNIYDTAPHVRACCAYARNIQIEEGVCPAFADCGIYGGPDSSTVAFIQRHFPQDVLKRIPPLTEISGYVMTGLRLFANEAAFAEKAPEKAVFPPRSLFENAGIYIGRSGTPETGTFGIAFKAGHNNEQHNHNDVGSFVVVLNKTPYFLDPGSEIYTRRTFSSQRYVSQMLNSYGHMVPVVAGKLQTTGGQSRGKFIQTDFTKAADTIVCDMQEAYRNVPELKSLLRTVRFDREKRVLVVRDDVEYTTPQSFSTALVTYKNIHKLNDNTYAAYDGQGGLKAVIATEGAELVSQVGEIINENATNPKRIDVALAKPVTKGSITITISEFAEVTELPGFYHAPEDLAALKPLVDQAVLIEAEKISAQEGGEISIEDKPGAQGLAFKFWDHRGHRLSWDVEIPKDGTYAIQLKLAIGFTSDDGQRAVAIDGKLVHPENAPMLLPHTTGWASTNADDWKEAWLARDRKLFTVKLAKGKHTLTMENVDGKGVNLDWIKFVPLP